VVIFERGEYAQSWMVVTIDTSVSGFFSFVSYRVSFRLSPLEQWTHLCIGAFLAPVTGDIF